MLKKLSLFVFAILFLAGCNRTISDSTGGNISFELKEMFAKDRPHIWIVGETNEIIESPSLMGRPFIETKVTKNGNIIKLEFGKVISPSCFDDCVSKSNAAIDADINSVDGDYSLELVKEGKVDKYELKIDKDKVTLTPIEVEFTKVTKPEIKRVPQNFLEAKCEIKTLSNMNGNEKIVVDYCQKFFDHVSKVASPYLIPAKENISKNAFYIYGGPDNELINLAKSYKRPYFDITFIRWNGKSISCNHGPCGASTGTHVPEISIEYLPTLKKNESECRDNSSCLSDVAIYFSDPLMCNKIYSNDHNEKNFCFARLGIATLNSSICLMSNYNPFRNECIVFVALNQHNEDLCLVANASRAKYCYTDYAVETEDSAICGKTEDDKDRCLLLVRERMEWGS